MSSGIKGSCNRPKQPRGHGSVTEKKFRNDSDEAREKYKAKIAARKARKQKRR